MLNCLINRPETRKDIVKALGSFYDELDFDLLDKMDFNLVETNLEERKQRRSTRRRTKRGRKRKNTDFHHPASDNEEFDIEAIRKCSYTAAIEITQSRRKGHSMKFKPKSSKKKRNKSLEKVYIPQTLPKIRNRRSSKEPLRAFKLFDMTAQSPSNNSNHSLDYDAEKGIDYLTSMIPIEIRILCTVIYSTLKKNKHQIEYNSEQDLLEILGNFLYYNWLIFVLFIQPHIYGLLKNNDVNALLQVSQR